MKTIIYNNTIGDCASIIRKGGIVAVPTETVYGLASNGLDADAVSSIYEVKNRPEIKPLSLMVESVADIDKYCYDAPQYACQFLKKHWPGPVTAIFKARSCIPKIVLAGGSTVGLRCPDANLTLQLIHESGVPLAAPSANPSGLTSAKDAETVCLYFNGKIDAIVDGGKCKLGNESLIIDFTSEKIKILRFGFLKLHLLGITGQTGAGKTSVLNFLKQKQFAIIDCDELYHDLISNDEYMNKELRQAFPDAYLNGKLNRKLLSKIVFSDPNALLNLNRITHSYVICAIFDKLIQFYEEGFTNVAIDAIELISSGIGDMCNSVIGLIANPEIRMMRIMKRDKISSDEAMKRIESQKNESYYRENCDILIDNNGTESELILQLEKVLNYG